MIARLKYVFFFCFCITQLQSQNVKAISTYLQSLKRSNQNDTTKIILYLNLASAYSGFKNDSSIYYSEQAELALQDHPNLNLETEAKYLKGFTYYVEGQYDKSQLFINQALVVANGISSKAIMAKCYNLLGAIQFNKGDFDKALEAYNNKLKLVTELHDTLSIIESHYNMSLINNDEGNYYKSLEHNYTALQLAEMSKDTASIVIAFEGLGISYTKIQDTKNAILYLEKALNLSMKRNDLYVQGGIMIDLGNVYRQINEPEKALSYYQKGEEISANDGDKLTGAIATSGKAETYIFLKKYNEAIQLFNAAIILYKEINYPKGITENYLHLANCNILLNNNRDSKIMALSALSVLKTINEKQLEDKAYYILSKVYEKLGNSDSAYICFRKHITIRDTLETRAALKKISEYESSIEKDRLEEERLFAEKTANEELVKQKQIRNTTIIAAVIILLLLIFVYRSFILKQKANLEISQQKKLIEHKNKDILDSINYSKRLQDAVLTAPGEIKRLLPESFVFYKPKSLVSSDFYFIEEGSDKNEIHVALANCTDPGVPGAFMSIIGHNLLKKAIKQPQLKEPGEILEYINKELKGFLRNEKNKEIIVHGIDLAYCILNFKTGILKFSGANNPIWISSINDKPILDEDLEIANTVNGRKLYCLKANKQSIGFYHQNVTFKDHQIKMEKGDVIYLYTGANPDDLRKEITEKKFPRLLNASSHHSPEIAATQLENELNNLQSGKEPLNDICVIGIKV